MKHHKKTDRIIRKKMENYSMGAPMHLFEGIANALDAEAPIADPVKKSGRSGYWLLALLILVLAGGGIWYSASNSSLKHNDNSSTSFNDSELKVNAKGNLNPGILNTDKKIVENSNDHSNLLEKINEQGLNTSNTNAASLSFETINSESTDFTSSKSPSESFEGKSKNPLVVKQTTTTSTSKNIQNTTFNASIPKTELTEKGIGGTAIEREKGEAIPGETTTSAASNKASKKTFSKTNTDVLFLPELKSTQNFSESKSTFAVNVEPVCGIKPDGSRVKFTTSVDALFSLDFASQILEYKSEDFKDYAQTRTETENPYYSFQTGVRVNFLTEFDWALRTGLMYTQINEILKTELHETRITTDPSTGDTTDISSGIRIVNRLNRYQLVDIPVLIGYEMQMKKFRLNVNGGVFVNLISEQSGAIYSLVEERVVYFTEGHPDDHDIFKDNIGFSTYLSLGFNIDLGKKLQLIVEPNIRFYPKSFTLDEYVLNQKYLSTGLMVGLRKDL